MSDVREAFEALDKIDETLTYLAGNPEHMRRTEIATIKAALQSAQGEGEPVAWYCVDPNGADPQAATTEHQRWTYERAGRVTMPLYTHPAPPSVAVPSAVTPEMIEAAEQVDDLYLRGTPEVWADVFRAMLTAAPQPDHPGDADKEAHWAVDNPGQADQRRAESRAVRKALGFDPDADDVSPCDLVAAIPKPDHSPDAGEELLPSVREYLQQGIYDATHCEDADQDHAFAKQLHDILNRPAQPRNELDSEDQKGMERIVEAVAKIGIDVDFGFAPYDLQQCHIDRAREIKESLARLRASQQEGGDDSE